MSFGAVAMGFTSTREASNSDSFRELLEYNYQRTSLVQMTSGSSIPLLRNHLWLVVRGIVKLGCVTIHGDEVLLGLAGPNELFGESLAGPEAYEATTLSECDLLCMSYGELEKDVSFAPALLKAICQRQRQSQAMLAIMGLRRVEDRVRGFLELLALEYGVACPQGLRLTPKLTHQEIANALGTTRVTVTRVIGQLRETGWLSMDPQRSLILAPLPRR
ncbi:MAG: Crp/Fnr family transcriptional regulator [Cyanobacteriota bacterium]